MPLPSLTLLMQVKARWIGDAKEARMGDTAAPATWGLDIFVFDPRGRYGKKNDSDVGRDGGPARGPRVYEVQAG